MEESKPIRSSDHLKDVLKIKVGNDKDGKPVLIPEKKKFLAGFGIKRKGEKEFKVRSV